MTKRYYGWDNMLALGYAAEQLFVASQLLTSDTVALPKGVEAVCEQHLGNLLRYEQLLPATLSSSIRECRQECRSLARTGAYTTASAEKVATHLRQLLEQVRNVLAALAGEHGSEDRPVDRQAA